MRGDYRHVVTLQNPGAATPDGQGGYTQTVSLLAPSWYCSIRPASQRDLERVTAGTTLTAATHIIEGDYRADITTKTQINFEGRLFYVNGIQDVEERHVTLVLLCSEVLP